jgi:hypothetical protein
MLGRQSESGMLIAWLQITQTALESMKEESNSLTLGSVN